MEVEFTSGPGGGVYFERLIGDAVCIHALVADEALFDGGSHEACVVTVNELGRSQRRSETRTFFHL